jgi:hypothetical protein
MKKYYTYIWIYRGTRAPHLLPKYVPDKLLSREVAYQTVEKGATTYLSEKNKRYWPIFPIQIGSYSLKTRSKLKRKQKHSRSCASISEEPKSHDPRNVVYEHMKAVRLAPQIMHEA